MSSLDDVTRQLFNIECSRKDLRRRATLNSEKSRNIKELCRSYLADGKLQAARQYASKAISLHTKARQYRRTLSRLNLIPEKVAKLRHVGRLSDDLKLVLHRIDINLRADNIAILDKLTRYFIELTETKGPSPNRNVSNTETDEEDQSGDEARADHGENTGVQEHKIEALLSRLSQTPIGSVENVNINEIVTDDDD